MSWLSKYRVKTYNEFQSLYEMDEDGDWFIPESNNWFMNPEMKCLLGRKLIDLKVSTLLSEEKFLEGSDLSVEIDGEPYGISVHMVTSIIEDRKKKLTLIKINKEL